MKVIKVLLLSVSFLSSLAQGQVFGTYRYDGQYWHGPRQQVILVPQQVQQPPRVVAQQAPCTWGGRWGNILQAGAVGALVGVLVTDTDRGTGKGAALGIIAGTQIPCDVQQPVTQVRQCEAGTSWKTLNWSGHPQHGKEACLPSEEQIQLQKQTVNTAPVTVVTVAQIPAQSTVSQNSCAAGKTWKTLNWPGHPQHGKTGCLPSDEKIEADKRTHMPAPN